ncbi:hypothetical protein L6R50_14110 [Myxococcota bacterium]|nr:hypothetical protein [Myxococcota bacterium]
MAPPDPGPTPPVVPRPLWPLALPALLSAPLALVVGPVPVDPGWVDALLLLGATWTAAAGVALGSWRLGDPPGHCLGRGLLYCAVGPVATAFFTGTVTIPPAVLWTDAGLPQAGLQGLVTAVWFGFAGLGGAWVLARVRRRLDRTYPRLRAG